MNRVIVPGKDRVRDLIRMTRCSFPLPLIPLCFHPEHEELPVSRVRYLKGVES